MKLTIPEIVEIVQRLINEKAEERKKELWERRKASGDYIQEVHEASIDIDPSSFKIISETINENGDILIEWEAIEYVTTEFTLDEPYRFEKKGKLLLKKNGDAELL